MSTSQFNLAYLPQEDRLLLQLNADDKAQYQFLLTRRLTLQLMEGFAQLLEQTNSKTRATAAVKTPEASAAMQQFEHSGAIADADFKTPFSKNASQRPLGDKAILLHTVQLSILKTQQVNLRLLLDEQQSLDIQITPDSLHALYHIFSQSIQGADWNKTFVDALEDAKVPAPRHMN